MRDVVEMVDLHQSEDVSLSAIPVSGSTSDGSMYGPGSATARVMIRMGKFLISGVEEAVARRRLAFIYRQMKSNCAAAAQNAQICDGLLELSRLGLRSKKIRRKAWEIILSFLRSGEVTGLVNSLSRWREVEIQIFLNQALLYMPMDWIADPLAERRGRDSAPSQGDKLQLPRGFLKLLYELMTSNALALNQRTRQNKRSSFPLSLASFVSASGKMVLGPSAFRGSIRVQMGGQNALHNIIKSILCGRLNTMSTRLRFERGSSTPCQDMVAMLQELLSIYRSFPDDRCLQRQCRELLFICISRFHTVALVQTLATWTREELQGIICELASWLKPFVYSGMQIDNFLPKAYRVYLASHASTDHPVIPFLFFCIRIAFYSEVAANLLLDLDLIDMLRDMCYHDFPNPAANVVNTTTRTDLVAKSDIYASLTLLFAALSVHPSCSNRIFKIPTLPAWIISVHYTHDFIGLPTHPLLQDAWLQLDKHILKLILVSLEHTLKGDISHGRSVKRSKVDFLPLESVYRDIIYIIQNGSFEQEMVYSAADTFLTCVEYGAHSSRVLNKILSEARVKDTCCILDGIHRSLAPDFPPYHRDPSNPRQRPVSTRSYLNALAHTYSHELRMYSPLVDELLGSRTCNGSWPFGRRYGNHVRDSVISSISVPHIAE